MTAQKTEVKLQKPRLTIKQIIDAIEKYNGMVTLSSRFLGVSKWAIYKRARTNPAIKRAIEMSREEMLDMAESKLRVAIQNGEAWAIQLALKTVGKGRGYVERVEQTGIDGGAIQNKTMIYLPDNDRDKLDAPKIEVIDDGNTVTGETRDV